MKNIKLFEEFIQLNEAFEEARKQLDKFNYEEDKVKSSFISKDKVLSWKKNLEEKYPLLNFRFQKAGDTLHAEAEINRNILNEAKSKSQKYKGHKIPGKYLAGPQPGKMKKEIDKFRGKKEYKKDWDADYKSGKGGKGKRVKTKKSAATQAYQKMFGK